MGEYQSIMKNDVWDSVPRSKGKFVVTSKWIFKIKHIIDGSVEKHKAIFVARGFSQKEGVGLIICPILGTSPMCFLSLFRSNNHLKLALNHISSTLFLLTLYYANEVLIIVFSMFIHKLM